MPHETTVGTPTSGFFEKKMDFSPFFYTFPHLSTLFKIITMLFSKMSIPHRTPKNGAWFPPAPTLDPPCPHQIKGYGGMGVTSLYDFKKSMSQKPVFRRTRSHPTNYIHELFTSVCPVKPRCEKSLGGVCPGW
jgi:hypothetical protein